MAKQDDMTGVVLAKMLTKTLGTPEMRKAIRDAKTSTSVEDGMFIERLERLKHVLDEVLDRKNPSSTANRTQE